MNKNLVIISGLHLNDNNRGTAALGYGSIAFLREKGYVKEGDELVNFRTFKNPFRKYNKRISVENFWMDDRYWKRTIISVFYLEFWLFVNFHILIPFMPFKRYLNRVRLIAAINGGDGFPDIYGKRIFYSRLPETFMAMRYGIPLIFLPQTLGPFKDINNIILAKKILRYADKVYIRDDKFAQELDSMGVFYERTKDLSFYMKPEIVDIEIKSNSVGINISGLAYSNKFETLAGQFLIYPYLIHKLITCFQQKGIFVYLIPHSYNYYSADSNNDDIEAMQQAYDALDDKRNVYMIKKDLKAPQLKYIISKMNFFVGTRMHANFAAIYTGVPLFGLAYSYKFQGAFEANGVFNSTAIINNINELEADTIVKNIIDKYNNLA